MEEARKDDALFEALNKAKKRKKRRRVVLIVLIVLAALAGLTAGTLILRRRITRRFTASIGTVTRAKATVGSISTQVSGSGTLVNVDEEALTVPAGVQIKEVVAEAHDTFAEGDVLAWVDAASVMKAMAALQGEIAALDKEITTASRETVSNSITAGVAGRVKAVYAKAGDAVAADMYEHGALAVISLDGYMALELESDALSAGDKVRVVRTEGKELTGTVDSAEGGRAVILVTDNGPREGEIVELLDAEGNSLGAGALSVHSPLRVTGVAGTVSAVRVKENQKVTAASTLFSLKDTDYSANYQTLLEQRSDMEDTMVELMGLYNTGSVTAPYGGSVTSVDYDEDMVYEGEIPLATISPDQQMNVTLDVDESNILSLELGQTAQVTISSIGDDEFSGTVTEINKTANSASGVTRYSAVVTMDKTPEMLQGMSAKVVIRISGVDNAVIIPVEALHQTSSAAYVYTTFDEETQEFGGMVNVEVGIKNSTYAEILSGLREGDTVCYKEAQRNPFANMGFNNRGGYSGSSGNRPGGNNSGSGRTGSGSGGTRPGGNGGN